MQCHSCFVDEKPDVQYADIGGMDIQKQEVREAVELPLTHFDLYKQIGIDPPRGVLMYGPPGCGKTMLAKAVAHHTTGKKINKRLVSRSVLFIFENVINVIIVYKTTKELNYKCFECILLFQVIIYGSNE